MRNGPLLQYYCSSCEKILNESSTLTIQEEELREECPRPTIQELKQVIYPAGLAIKPLNSQNQLTNIGFVPDPNEKQVLIHNPKEHLKLRREEAKRRQEIMFQIIESRSK